MSRSQTKTLGSLGVFYQTMKKTACKSLAFINKSVMLVKMSMDVPVFFFFWGGVRFSVFPHSHNIWCWRFFSRCFGTFFSSSNLREMKSWDIHETDQVVQIVPQINSTRIASNMWTPWKNHEHDSCYLQILQIWRPLIWVDTHTQTHHISDHSTYWYTPGICLHNNNQHVFCKSMASTSWSIRNCQGHQCL